MVYLSKKNFEALQTAKNEAEKQVSRMKMEVKGYMDDLNEANEYFRAISNQMRRLELPSFDTIDRKKIMEIYKTSAPVQGVVNMIADNVGEVMRYLELTQNGDAVEKHWVLDLLRRPNDRFTLRKFGQAWAINKLVFGDAWVYVPSEVGAHLGEVKEMYVVPSHRIAIDHGKVKPIENYEIIGKEKVKVDTAKLMESFDYNMDDDSYFGTSKIVAAAVYLDVMDKGMKRQDTALKNGGVSNIITPAKDNMGIMPKDADALEEKMNSQKNFGKTMPLRIPVDVHALGNAPVDLSILESHKEAVTALCFVYKLPVDLYYGQSKYENAKEAKKTIYEQMAIPMANEFAEDLVHFLKLDEEGFELKVNTDFIDVLKDDTGEVLDNLTKMHATLNEMREAYGYDPIEEDWANQPILPLGVQFGNEGGYDIDEMADVKPKKKQGDGEEDQQ